MNSILEIQQRSKKKKKKRMKPTIDLVFRIQKFVKNRRVSSILLVPQELHFLAEGQIEKPLAVGKNLVHEFLADPVINHIEETRIQTCLPQKKKAHTIIKTNALFFFFFPSFIFPFSGQPNRVTRTRDPPV